MTILYKNWLCCLRSGKTYLINLYLPLTMNLHLRHGRGWAIVYPHYTALHNSKKGFSLRSTRPTAIINLSSVVYHIFSDTLDAISQWFPWHRWDLPLLHYHKIMLIYPYPFLMVISLVFSWIIFINDCICILTGSPG